MQTVTDNNQTFSGNGSYTFSNNAASGCAGVSGNDDESGSPGSPGQPSGGINNNATNVTLSGVNGSGGFLQAAGGDGGAGGSAGTDYVHDVSGGNGGGGGAGGPITMNFSGSIGAGFDVGLLVFSVGGAGGDGGGTGTFGDGDKVGGNGGNGGAGGMVQFTGGAQVQAFNDGILVESTGANGGVGASVSTSDSPITTYGGNGGNGGQAGAASLTWQSGLIQTSALKTTVNGSQGLLAESLGGGGGNGGSARSGNTNYGGLGGVGGNGETATVTMSGGSVMLNESVYNAYNAALLAVSEGGNGGAGGTSGALNGAAAGSGGAGGTGGSASASVDGTIDFTGLGLGPGHAIYVASSGGQGGAGGNASASQGNSGGGGFAGSAGAASLTVGTSLQAPAVTSTGKYANAAVVQSIGGGGGNGGVGSFFVGGGAGAPGGDGGSVNADIANGSLVTSSASASGLIAQSIGGGGGIGGDSNGIAVGADISIGGNGGLGGNGNGVTVQLGANAIVGSLNPLGDNAVLAQSIGGSGGAGGTAVSTGAGIVELSIGGDAGGGGEAGAVQIDNDGLTTSYGDHAAGLQAQSIGGGGGKGGSAVTFVAGVLASTAVSIGGRGGSGGPAAGATIASSGQITTYGSNAYGILAQSIGGGGGSGGSTAARAVAIAPSDSLPAISFALAIGGAGGSGNTGAAASVMNSGIVTTAGEGAYAMVAQSIGGGGGVGGDSTAAAYSGGSSPAAAVSIATAIGGSGGTGATAGTASLDNTGLLLTYGADAYGAFAQSVGGGGGAGGGGDSSATASQASVSIGASLAVGGTGGIGGEGGAVNAMSNGGILTNGDGADGLFAQSVGGGGGAGGGGVAAANGGTLTVSVGVGGSGGAGGNGGSVTASNGGAIVTRGTDAAGLLAQSVGGGGGVAGKGGATSGGVSAVTNAGKLYSALSGGLNIGGKVTTEVDGILKIGKLATSVYSAASELEGIAQQLAGNPSDIGSATAIDIGVSVGGKGGAAGNGGTLTVDNTGEVSTFGAQSDGVFAESVGGGGGEGGAASSTDTSTDDSRVQTAIGVGGAGGAGGNGGDVSVINDSGASIETQGVLGFGILAQSVGGGGGTAGLAGTVAGSLKSLSVAIGGSSGSFGTGGNVMVANNGAITTTGKNGIGVFAQSVGGGGGLVRTMTTNETFDPADIIDNPQGRLADVQGLTLSFSGSSNTTGNAGAVQIDNAGSITTGGRDAHAIVAQSIGGGGGAAIGGQVIAGQANGGTSNGDASTVSVTTTTGSVIATGGDGAYGILAQSIGGGGGLGGDLANVTQILAPTSGTNAVEAGNGNGGQVTIGLAGTNLSTTGKFAPAIYAQSLGGGGGLIAENGDLFSGGAGGSGNGGNVSVALVDSIVSATGIQSPGIAIQTNGSGSAAVSIDAQSTVTGGAIDNADETTMSGAIYLQQGVGDSIVNAGQIIGAGVLNPIAVRSDAAVQITNTGTITGAVITGGNASTLTNQAGGVFDPGATIDLGPGGSLVNAGKLYIGGAGTIGTTTLTGNLSGPGKIVFDADFVHGASDRLAITGNANIAGQIEVDPTTLRNATLELVAATGGLTLDPALTATPSAAKLFTYNFTSDGAKLYATPQAQFVQAAAALGQARQAVASHLQTMFDSGELFDAGYTALANLDSPQDYARTLESLTGQGLGGIAAERYQASSRFVSDVDGGCDAGGAASCSWARIQGGQTNQDETADALGYDATYQMYEMGAETRIADALYISSAIAYEQSQLSDAEGSAQIRGDSALGVVGLHYRPGAFEIVGSIDGGYGWYHSDRQITVGTGTAMAYARPRLWNIGADVTASYRVKLGTRSFLKPFAELRGSDVQSDAFGETSSSEFALDVMRQNNFAVSGGIGASLGTTIVLRGGTQVTPFVSAAAELSGDTDWNTSARFVGDTTAPFTVQTNLPGTFGRFGIGADLARGANFDLVLSYNPEIGSHYSTQQGVARLTYRF